MTEENNIRRIVITVMLAVLVMVSFGTFISGFDPRYNVTADTGWVNESQEYSQDLEESAQALRDSVTKFKWWNPLGWFEGIKSVTSLLWNAGGVTTDFITALPSMFGLGETIPFVFVVIGIVTTIIILIVAFELISAVIKRGV